jgi:hypothetical protein
MHDTSRFTSSRNPYYALVPKSLEANLAYRKEILAMGSKSARDARALWEMASKDLLWYINTFVWTYSPRACADNPYIPMITWEYQDETLLRIEEAIGHHNLLAKKSRDVGLTWMVMATFEWRWHFKSGQKFMCASRKEDLVDRRGDPDCLFAKIDCIHDHLPSWMKPPMERTTLMLVNLANKSTITGESTNGDLGRGGRSTALFLDEFASVENGAEVSAATEANTNCRIFVSTPKGTGNEFYRLHQRFMSYQPKNVISIHWSRHPEFSKGLYYKDGKPRSPWYDAKEATLHPVQVASELDLDFMGSDYAFFDSEMLDAYIAENARAPMFTGDIDYDPTTLEIGDGFVERSGGPLLLWTPFGLDGRPPKDHKYVFGVDVSQGTGASASVISIGDKTTREKIGEFATAHMRPDQFATYTVALARLFNDAFICYESNGPGRPYGDRLIELGYRNLYYRRQETSLSHKVTDVPGWAPTKEGKEALLHEYYGALKTREFINRSRDALEECRCYIHAVGGGLVHIAAQHSDDPSGAKANHSDRCIADALLSRHIKSSVVLSKEITKESPYNSLAGRRILLREDARRKTW